MISLTAGTSGGRMSIRLLSVSLALGAAAFAAGPAPSGVTFSRDVAPVLYKRCVECHRQGEVAGISFTSYKEVRPWAKAIKEKVLTRTMPPWLADPHYGNFRNDRRLSQQETNTIVSWVDAG